MSVFDENWIYGSQKMECKPGCSIGRGLLDQGHFGPCEVGIPIDDPLIAATSMWPGEAVVLLPDGRVASGRLMKELADLPNDFDPHDFGWLWPGSISSPCQYCKAYAPPNHSPGCLVLLEKEKRKAAR